MPDEPAAPSPDSSPPFDPTRRVSTGLAGETTGSLSGPTATPRSDGGTLLPSSAPLREVIGDFEVLGKLGQGGMGAVYRARQVSLDRQVALKILPAALEADPDFVSRFQREARVAASLSHGNLVKVYAAGQADGCHFIAMELIEGETLGDWLKRGPLSPLEALRICADVAHALAHGWHRAQLIHRDIKPGNIFLSTSGDVKVGDLGLAKTLGGDTTGLTQTGTAMGTPHYISPEQARGDRDVDFRSDIYSLGCTLYQMLTGRTPYEGRDPVVVLNQHINAPPPAILKVMPSCPIPLARLVGKMLKKVKRERHASYEELLAQIESVRALFDPSLTFTPPPPAADPDATLLQTPATPARRPATRPATVPVAPPPKSKTLLYAGVAVIVILPLIAFLAWPKKENLTKAEIQAQQRAAEQQAKDAPGASESTETTPRPAPPEVPAAGPAAAPRIIKIATGPDDLPKMPSGRPFANTAWADDALRLGAVGGEGGVLEKSIVARDAILRARVRLNPEAVGPQLCLRTAEKTKGGTFYRLAVATGVPQVSLFAVVNNQAAQLDTWKLDRPTGASEWVALELRCIGNQITAVADGRVLGTVADDTITEPGGYQIYTQGEAYFRDIEYVPLDGAAASATTAWEPLVPAEKWQLNVLGQREYRDGLLHFLKATNIDRKATSPDGAIRAVIQHRTEGRGVGVHARWLHGVANYSLQLSSHKQVVLRRNHASGPPLVMGSYDLPQPLQVGDRITLELRVVGNTLTGLVNGQPVLTAKDNYITEPGYWSIIGGDCIFQSAEYQPLPPLPPPAAPEWQPAFTTAQWQGPDPGSGEFREGLVHLVRGASRMRPIDPADAAFRATIRVRLPMKPLGLQARWVNTVGGYRLSLSPDGNISLRAHRGAATVSELARYKLAEPLREGDTLTLGLRIIADRLIGYVNGEPVMEAIDRQYPAAGIWGIYADDGWFESAEYQPLPQRAEQDP